MSNGNAAAAIGLANTSKIPMIGTYIQDTALPQGPSAEGPYIGILAAPAAYAIWDANPVDEAGYATNPGFVAPSTNGAATGKDARLVSTGASPMTVAADGLCSVSTVGVVTATATTGLYKTYIAAETVIPLGKFIWVFLQ